MRLSIIIVSWNVSRQLRDCLDSLDAAHLPDDWEVVVFDNASQDDSVSMVRQRFPMVRLIASEQNIGYAAGNNRAALTAHGEYLLFLNPDTLVSQSAIHQLLACMDDNPRIGACSPQLLLPDGSPQPYAFGGDPTPGYLFRRGWNRLMHGAPLHDWSISEPTAVDWVSGAAMLVRQQAWRQTGGFDEDYFMYFEDNDLCLRMRQQGWRVLYQPQIAITHLGGSSSIQNDAIDSFYHRSLHLFYRKHYGIIAATLLRFPLAAYKIILANRSSSKDAPDG